MMSVADAYVNVLKAEQSLKLSQSEEKSIARQLDQTKERFNVGLVAITDVHNAQASYDQTQAALIGSQTQLELAKLGLEILTGYNDELLAIGSISDIPKTLPNSLDFWVDQAMKNNLNIQISAGSVDLANKGLEVDKAARLPTVGLQAGYTFGSGDAGENWRHSSNVGVSVSVPIYSGGQVSSSIAQSFNTLTQSELQLEGIKRNTRLAIIQLYRTLSTNLATIIAQEQVIVSRESALKATEVGLEVGTQTVVDVLAAQSALFGAQKQLSDTKFDYVLNELRLKQAAGTLSKADLSALTQ
jgi:outer membrane protein